MTAQQPPQPAAERHEIEALDAAAVDDDDLIPDTDGNYRCWSRQPIMRP